MPSSFLIRAPNWLGDCIMALPVFSALRKRYPAAHIAVACRPHLTDCFSAAPEINEVISCPVKRGWKSLPALWGEGAALRGRFDVGILLTNSFSTALWLWRSRTPTRIGFARDGRGLFLTTAIRATPELCALHQADYYLHLLRQVDADPTLTQPRLTVPAKGVDAAARLFSSMKLSPPFAVLAPTSAYGSVKDWPIESYATVARRLHQERGLTVLITGVSAHADLCQQLAVLAGEGVHNLAGKVDLAGFLGIIRAGVLFLGGDSGGAHAAAALNLPTIVVFGITEPSRTRALGCNVRNVGRGGMETPRLSDPKVQAAARAALTSITPDEVGTAISETAGWSR